MKLIYCSNCKDIYNLNYKMKSCSCGKTKGIYVDRDNVLYGGDFATCLGLDNNGIAVALENQRLDGYAVRFDSYVCALFCDSTIKIDGFENITEKELCLLISKHNFPKQWIKKVEKRRTGLGKIVYSICKSLMNLEINKLDKKILDPEFDKWYSNFSERIFLIAKKLNTFTPMSYSVTQWFSYLLSILFKEPEYIIQLEKIKDDEDLYDEIYEYSNKDECVL